MAKRRRETDTQSVVTPATCSTVFIDTSLDTHLAMIVSDSDTVSDLKKKVTFEHLQCFPKVGEIKIHALKVKRKGHFYHLSNSMLVKSAFEAGKRNWFVSVDASSLKQQSENQHSCKSDASNPLALVCFPNNPSGESSLQKLVSTQCTNQKIPNADHSSKDVDIEVKDITSDDADRRSDIKIQEMYEVTSEGAKVAATNQKNDNSRNGFSRVQCNNSLEQSLETTSAVKNKRKIKKHNDEVVHDGGLKDNIAYQTSRPETVGPANSLVSAGKEVSNDMEMGSKGVNEENSQSRPAAKKKRKIESNECSRNPLDLGSGEKNIKRKGKYVLSSHNDQTPTFVLPVQDVEEERSFNENVENNHKDFCNEKLSELIQEVVERKNVTCSSIGTDMRETDAGNIKGNSDAPELAVGLNEGGADLPFKEPVLSAKLSNVKVAIEFGDYDGSKRKKKRVKKSAIRNQDSPGMEQANNAMSGIALTVLQSGTNHHFSDKTKKDESIVSHPECKEVPEQKSIDGSSSGAGREDDIMIGNEAERFPLIQKNNDSSLNHDAEQMLSERGKERAVESGKVDGTKKKVKRVKKSAARNQDVPNLKHANNVLSGGFSQTAPNSAINGHSSDKMKKDESVLSHVEREEASQHKSVDTSFVASDRECDNMSGNETESLPLTQVNRSKENADNVDAKSGKKFRKGRISTPKLLSDFPVKEQEHVVKSLQLNEVEKNQDTENMDIRLKKKTRNNQKSTANSRPDLPISELGVDELTASNSNLRDVDTPSKTTKERRSVKTSPVNELTGSELERKKNTGVEPEAKTDGDEHMKVSKGEGDEINFKHYFVPGQEENEFAPVDKLKEDRRPDGEMKAKKNRKKPVVSSLGTSPDLRNTDRSYENQGARKKSSIKSTISNQPQESLSKEEDNEVMPPPKKSLKVSGNAVKTGTDVNFHGTSTPADAYKKGNNELLAASRSSPQSSDRSLHSRRDNKRQPDVDTYHAAVRKGSTKNTGQGEEVRKASTEAKNSSQHEKSLLATPGAIFSDDSRDSSADENRSVNSDTRTRTPSHNSSSSGSSLDSPRNGSYDAKRKEGGKNIMKSQSAGPKNITMDMIFRSSSRFMKAKLAALGDSESQAVDFVPDSQANM